jgi:ATP-dependent RNA helicase SUPV3L1/SUV3
MCYLRQSASWYSTLIAETRVEQAKRFNSENAQHSILVATDAVGMGLNLNIRRIIFETLMKFDGEDSKYLSVSQMKQIAGRAGRFQSRYENGLVTSLFQNDFKALSVYMSSNPKDLEVAGLLPNLEQIERFSMILPGHSLGDLLLRFEQLAILDGNFFLCKLTEKIQMAELIEKYQMTLTDRYCFINAPCSLKEPFVSYSYIYFAASHSRGACVTANEINSIFHSFPGRDPLITLELRHRIVMLYLWLSQRLPETFCDKLAVNLIKKKVEEKITQILDKGHAERGIIQ